jgi:hypothetical protein
VTARRVLAVTELADLLSDELEKDPEADPADALLQVAERACCHVVRIEPNLEPEPALAQQLRDIADALDPPEEVQP